MTDPILTAVRALAYDLGLTEEGPHGPELRESAVRKIQAFALRQRAAEVSKISEAIRNAIAKATEAGGLPSVPIMLVMMEWKERLDGGVSRLEAQAKELEP